jgi:hypothetical protein
MDPELAALLKQMEGSGPEEAAAAEPAAPAEPAPAEPAPAEEDPELLALLQQLEGDAAEAEAVAAQPPAEEALDPELAALMQQLEGEAPAEASPPPAEPEAAPAAEETDPELAALMQQLEASPAEPSADPLRAQVEALGGLAALDDLGWPTFASSFAEDLPRQLRLLQGQVKNRAAEKEVRELVKKCGGYPALASEGVTPQMGLNAQLKRLREIRATRERAAALTDQELLQMATAYGARLKSQKTDDARVELLLRVKDYDRWASDARNADAAAALDGAPFEERRQVQLEQQLKFFGGEQAYSNQVARHPQDGDAKAPLDRKVSVLRTLRDYNWLGGDAAYAEKVGQDGAEPLAVRLEKLKAVVSAQE